MSVPVATSTLRSHSRPTAVQVLLLALICALPTACAQTDVEPAPLESSHVGLGIGTLVPVTEASVWKSSCKPTEQPTLRAIRSKVLALPSIPERTSKYSGLHVRAAILSNTETIFVAEGLQFKIVGPSSVQYKSTSPTTELGAQLAQAFRTCA